MLSNYSVGDQIKDIDPEETNEWLSALQSIIKTDGIERAEFIINNLVAHASDYGMRADFLQNTPYCNTIPLDKEPPMPGDPMIEQRIRALTRWNAMAMVVKTQEVDSSLGGHIGTFASSATLYDVGFNHFWRGLEHECGGDLLYIQGHTAPGIYARSYMLGDLSDEQLNNFRREVDGKGLSSYPHPWLMPDFWQFPTVSMGLGPLQAIYQARFMKYLENRELIAQSDKKVWCFCGDGEMDEPESLGGLSLAGREKLDNLIFVINCNLQRLDGPVRGNGKIIQELETVFRGSGWNVIKVIWGAGWDPLLMQDDSKMLLRLMEEAVDGDYQNYKAKGGAYTRENFFNKYPETKRLVQNMSDEDIWRLNRGGHDPKKVHAAYKAAVEHKGQPTVILAKTIKGYGLGKAGEALNIAHNTKKLDIEDLKAFRDRFNIPIDDEKIADIPFFKPEPTSVEGKYLAKSREKLGGRLPARRRQASASLKMPDLEAFKGQLASTNEREISTTMAFVRILASLAKDKKIGKYIVPIVPDEARTFGMEGLFRQLGIYAAEGQKYEPVDSDQVMYYKEAKNGQILEEGINEAGAFCSWMASATSYSNYDLTTIPFYIYYSMFGFQRIGDFAWAAGDMRSKGFLMGATAGRTTLNGEGLQHQDGHSHLIASTIPNCKAYDPAFAYELSVIIQHGLKDMYEDDYQGYYYITLMNENYTHPGLEDLADSKLAQDNIIKGLYLLKPANKKQKLHVRLLGAGAILNEAIKAADILAKYNISSDVYSVTSFNELKKQALKVVRQNNLNPDKPLQTPFVAECLNQDSSPIIAATDYMQIYAEQISPYLTAPYYCLGTDGFGRSDSREKLRKHFEVDSNFIAYQAIKALVDNNQLDKKLANQALKDFNIDTNKPHPLDL